MTDKSNGNNGGNGLFWLIATIAGVWLAYEYGKKPEAANNQAKSSGDTKQQPPNPDSEKQHQSKQNRKESQHQSLTSTKTLENYSSEKTLALLQNLPSTVLQDCPEKYAIYLYAMFYVAYVGDDEHAIGKEIENFLRALEGRLNEEQIAEAKEQANKWVENFHHSAHGKKIA